MKRTTHRLRASRLQDESIVDLKGVRDRRMALENALQTRIESYIQLDRLITGGLVASTAFTASNAYLKRTVPALELVEKTCMVGDKDICEASEKAFPRDKMLKRAELVETTLFNRARGHHKTLLVCAIGSILCRARGG